MIGSGVGSAYVQQSPISYWAIGNVEWKENLLGNGANIPNVSAGSPLQDGSTSWAGALQKAIDDLNAVLPDEVLTLGIVQNSGVAPGSVDGVNNVAFSETVYGNAWGGSVVGISISNWTGNHRMENDVLFNGTKTWNSYEGNQQGGVTDFRRIALHEFGHSLGLNHPDQVGQVVSAIMNSVSGDLWQLQPDDIDGLLSLYEFPIPLVIKQAPKSYSTPVGGTWSLSVVATGSEVLVYDWERSTDGGANWAPIDGIGQNIKTWSYPNVQMGQNGWRIRVTVSNAVEAYQTDAAILTITESEVAPTFTTHPLGSQTLEAGGSVDFSAEVTGSPTPSIQWEYSPDSGTTWLPVVDGSYPPKGTVISGSTTTSLEIVRVDETQNGEFYRAVATNSAGSATSNTALLNVTASVAPGIAVQPSDLALNLGDYASLEAIPTGTAPFTFQWKKDGVIIPGSAGKQQSYYIQDAAPSHAGVYSFVVTNYVGSIESAPATVTVNVPLLILSVPADVFAVIGSVAEFSVSAQGNGVLSYQWKKDGVDIPGATGATFQIANAALADSGNYTVVVSNLDGSVASDVAALFVFEPLPIESRRIAVGAEFILFVEEDGTLKGAGTDTSGGMASNDDTRYFSPITLATGVSAVYSSSYFSYRLDQDGTLWGAGGNGNGQLGNGESGPSAVETTWIQIATGVASASAGTDFGFFVKQDGTLWAMGSNLYGQLGIPESQFGMTTTPALVARGVRAVSAGGTHAMFITVDNKLWGMGLNQSKQLGVDTAFGDFVPEPVVVRDGVSEIALGNAHSLFRTMDDKLWAMGWNLSGQVGDGTTTSPPAPVNVANDVARISAGFLHSLFIKTDGTLWGMGENEFGALGTGDVSDRTTPVQIASEALVAAGGGSNTTAFLKANGELWGTGQNTSAQFGDGTLVSKNTPVRIFTGVPTPQAPYITTNPVSQNANQGTLVQFSVTAFGDPVLSYQWRKDGVNIPGAISRFYQIASVQPSDAGTYSVVVTNGIGNATSSGATLTVNEVPTAPAITTHPASLSVAVGQAAGFTVAASGTAPFSYQWQKGGADIPGATSAAFNIASAQLSDAGTYTAVVTNALGSATSNAATLTVTEAPVAPSITTQPASQRVLAGLPATFSVQVSGTAPLTYQWRKDGVDIPGATSPAFQVSAVMMTDSGQYSVIVSNSVGNTTSNAALLSVIQVAYPDPGDQSLWANFLRWIYNILVWLFGGGGNSVGSDAGYPMVKAISALADQMQAFDLSVYRSFRDTVLNATPAGRYYIDLYQQLTPDLIETVVLNPSLVFEINNVLIEMTPAVQAAIDGNGASIQITQAMIDDTLAVIQLIRNAGSTDLRNKIDAELASLDLPSLVGGAVDTGLARMNSQTRPPPAIGVQPVSATIHSRGAVELSVDATGAGPITFQWRRNGVDIAGANGATYSLSSAQAADAGTYTVVVSNPFGSVTSTAATLTVTNPRLINVSTRAFAGQGDATLIVGFIISGSGSKTLIIRGVGPKLLDFNVPVVVNDPSIVLYSGQTQIGSNDDWDPALAADFTAVGAFALDAGSKDAAMKVTLGPGAYTIHLINPGSAAEAIVEVYDLSKDAGTRLINLSCRLNVNLGETIIVGTVLDRGSVPIIVRNIGPTLAGYNVQGVMEDPRLRVYTGQTQIAENDDWDPSLAQHFLKVGAFTLQDASKDAAQRLTLNPGLFTVHATGAAAGIVLVELYESP